MEAGRPASKAELIAYECHKTVGAAKIKAIRQLTENGGMSLVGGLLQFEGGDEWFRVGSHYIIHHQPLVGGYYVRYDDGYESWSPAKAFEDGYSALQPAD